MTDVLDAAALLAVAAAIVAGALALVRTRSPLVALPVLLDLLTAAGLLRLAGTPSWSALAVTAVVIALRRLVTSGIRRGVASRAGARRLRRDRIDHATSGGVRRP